MSQAPAAGARPGHRQSFLTSALDVAPPVLLHHLKHNKVLHERVILLSA